jgi:serine protease Do
MGLVGGFIGSRINGRDSATTTIPGGQTVNVQESSATIEAAKKVSPAVVSITTEGQTQTLFGTQATTGGGTGFIITNDGLIATNRHVVEAAQKGLTVVTADGTSYQATVAAVDPTLDFALIKVDAKNLPVVTLGDSDALEVGQNVIAVGNALGQFQNTVTTGVISAKERDIQAGAGNSTEALANLLQTDAAINPGNSGGPLVNLAGQVVGVNTAVSESAQGIGFAIPINQARQAIDSYTSGGKIIRASLGVRYVPVTKEVAQLYKLPVDTGALLRGSQAAPAVIAGSPAATAGLKEGDIILSFDGKKLDANTTLGELIATKRPGDLVELKYRRGNDEQTTTVTLSAR